MGDNKGLFEILKNSNLGSTDSGKKQIVFPLEGEFRVFVRKGRGIIT